MWRVYGGRSDGDGPTPEQVQQWARRVSAPENELPAPVGVAVVLARTGNVAVGLTQVEASSTGFRFNLAVRVRQPRPDMAPPRPDMAPGGLYMLVGSHSYPGAQLPLENRLLLSLEYADGRRTSNLTDPQFGGPGRDLDDDRLLLVPQGGGGSDSHVDQAFWVSPLPGGPVTVVLTWPVMGLPESRTVIDGTAITAAAAHSLILWPDQPPQDPPEPPPPPQPTDGWFAKPPS